MYGFIDVLDILQFFVQIVEQHAKQPTNAINAELLDGQFTKCTASSLISKLIIRLLDLITYWFLFLIIKSELDVSQADPYVTIPATSSLLQAVRIFSEEVHRLAVTDEETQNIINIISPIDIVAYLLSR